MLGKFRRSLNERCPNCNSILEIRVREIDSLENGVEIIIDEEYIFCSLCFYTREIKEKRKRGR